MTAALDPPSELPYGAWPSPISAEQVSADGIAFDGLRASVDSGGGVVAWWGESRPAEAGRTAIVSRTLAGEPVEWLPPGWNARTRVHEYGGGAWLPLAGGVVFSSFADGRLYRVDSPGAEPVAITPDSGGTVRYADLSAFPDGQSLVCVRDEVVTPDAVPSRSLVAVNVAGDVAGGGETVLFTGPHFLSTARVSPNGQWLAWLSWEHPGMPWDTTTLWLAEFSDLGGARQVAGGQALFQPGWTPDGRLLVVAERGDWWNLHEVVDLTGTPTLRAVWEVDEECGWPGWRFGSASWVALSPNTVALKHGVGVPALALVDLDTGDARPLDVPMMSLMPELASAVGTLICAVADATTPSRVLAVSGTDVTELAASAPLPDPRWVARPRHVEVPSAAGRVVHAYIYPPTNPEAAAPAGERPPYVMTVHGGPTGGTPVGYSAKRAFWTSRGIGVVDVDYAGSTGYGRAYRQALYGQWGVADVQDCVAVAEWLGEQGLADSKRMVISGGSAGGWTVLACLVRSSAFAAGASYFGLAELEQFARETHDFESRYVDLLVGPLPECRDLYLERAPLTHAAELRVPVLLLQGSEDKIVPPSQAELFRDAMVANRVPHAYLLYEGEGHGFRSRDAQVHSLGSELAFYGQVLGFDPPGVPPLELVRP